MVNHYHLFVRSMCQCTRGCANIVETCTFTQNAVKTNHNVRCLTLVLSFPVRRKSCYKAQKKKKIHRQVQSPNSHLLPTPNTTHNAERTTIVRQHTLTYRRWTTLIGERSKMKANTSNRTCSDNRQREAGRGKNRKHEICCWSDLRLQFKQLCTLCL